METAPLLFNYFQHTPTGDQAALIEKLAAFISPDSERKIFVIKGYAGTGKTSMVSAIAKTLSRLDKAKVVLAPTGREAKVLSNYTGQKGATLYLGTTI